MGTEGVSESSVDILSRRKFLASVRLLRAKQIVDALRTYPAFDVHLQCIAPKPSVMLNL